MMGRYPTQNQRFFNHWDISAIPSYHNLSPQAQARFEEQHPKYWYETQPAYTKRLEDTFQSSNLRVLKNSPIYNANPTQGFFPQASSIQLGQKTYTSLDIETDDYNHPISVVAHKFIQGPDGKFQSIDTYQRYYNAHSWDLRSTQAVHGFTSASLKGLRKQQGATYGTTYKGQEIKDLQAFLGDSIVVGHNIGEFDLQKLFPEGGFHNSTIDTLSAARNAWKGAKNSLDHVYYRIFGRTMEQDGLFHHDANADVIASMRIMEAMSKDKGHVGRAIRYIMNAEKGYHLTEYDEYMKSMVAKGNYLSMKGKGRGNLHEVYMKAEDYGLMEYDDDGNKMWVNGFHEDKPLSLEELADEQLREEAAREAAEWANDVKRRQGMKSLKKKGAGGSWLSNTVAEQDLFQEFNQFNNYKRLGLVQKIAAVKSEESLHALQIAAGYSTGGAGWDTLMDMAGRVRSAKEQEELAEALENARLGNIRSAARNLSEEEGWGSFNREDAVKKAKYLDKMERNHMITSEQRANLDLVNSYDDVVDATGEVIEANQRLEKTYKALASIKPYDINNLIGAAHGQWSGIKGAAHGVIPNFILKPLSRLGDAAMNSIDRSISPWNAFNRSFNAIVGPFMGGSEGAGIGGGGLGGFTKFKAGMGIFNAGTQIVGNTAQAKIEMKGLEIQNTLNTLGAMISWIATPFQLLHKASKLLIGSFTGLSFKLNNFMTNGIDLMSQMGNPLTELTGMNYNAYAGSTMMDTASLFGKGSMNSVYEDYAMQQQGLLLGNVNTQRMIAASMLGGFSDVYTSQGDAMTDYNTFANKILADMKGQSTLQQKQTMYLAGLIDKNLPSLLRTANLLGVTDVNQLADPSKQGMYWNTIDDTRVGKDGLTEAGRLRWTQYEYGAAREQMNYSKMRLANSLWNAGGKKIYNAFNELVDAAAMGNWETVINNATDMWKTFKDNVTGVWDAIKKSLGGDGEEGGESKLVGTFKTIGSLITNVAIDVAMKILDIWGDITNKLASKVQGLVAYLSTVSLKPHWDWKNGLSFSMESIDTADTPKGSTHIFKSVQGYMMPWDNRTKGYAALTNALFPDMSDEEKRKLTRDKLVDKLHHLPGIMKDGVLDTPELNLPEYFISGLNLGHNPELIEPLMDLLGKADSKGPGLRLPAAAYSSELRPYISKEIYDSTGIGNAVKDFNDFTLDTTRTTLQGLYNDNTAKVELWFKDDTGKKALIAADSKGSVLSKNLTLLSQMIPEGLKLVVNQLK